MKIPLVVGVREDQTREVVCMGAPYTEARAMVAAVATDGGEAIANGYVELELHMIGRETRTKVCKCKDAPKADKPEPKAKAPKAK